MKQVYLITPFPDMVRAVISASIMGRSENKELVKFHVKNLFDFGDPPHYRIDDYPFGGGAGMVLKPEPVFRAFDQVMDELLSHAKPRVVFPTPDGEVFSHEKAMEFCSSENLVFINGHYKGIDQRIRDELIILDAVIRLIPGVLNSSESAETDSFADILLDCPHYTRPESYRGLDSPSVLLTGNHKEIENWKVNKRREKTRDRRTDLWDKYNNLEDGKKNHE